MVVWALVVSLLVIMAICEGRTHGKEIPWMVQACSHLLVEQRRLRRWGGRGRQAQVQPGLGACQAAAGGALDVTLLHQEGLDDVLDRVAGLGDGVGEGLDAGGAAAV